MFKHSVILTNVGSCCDRYLSTGYNKTFTNEELMERVQSIGDIDAVELIGNSNVTKDNVYEVKKQLEKYGLKVISIIPDHFGKMIWGKGAFTSPDEEVRKFAIQETKDMMDVAKILGCDMINIWNGQDGYDYPLQVNYMQIYDWLVDGLRECAMHNKDIKLALEYKAKEPRNHSIISNVYSTLTLIDDIGCDNVGLTIDTGHSLLGYENMSEAICMASRRNKLFHMHFNDNYRSWDDDMITGSIHTIEFIEVFYWLKECGYDGYLSTDQYPYREDSKEAVKESLEWFKVFERISAHIDKDKMQEIFSKHDAVESTKYLRKIMFN